jgi:FMN phosphatase YigB (HAD superfamily)/broad-specificity NMP kinase
MTSFVYFDLGGVVELDFSGTNKWKQLKKELGISLDKDKEFEDFWNKYEAEVSIGRDVETLIPLIKEKFGSKFPTKYSLLMDGFVNRFEINKSIWHVIDKIHQKCRIGLLTNMYPQMFEAIKKRNLLPNVTWDVIIDSSVVGIQKPDSRIFKLGERRAGVKGKEILFVENTPGHVHAAKNFGWQTFLYDSAHPKDSSNKLLALFNTHMNKSILITGISGSGKSFLCEVLRKLGYEAYGIEEMHGLFAMVDKKTGKVNDDFDNQNLESIKQHDWICDKKKLKELIRKNSGKVVLDDMIFYCGTASNSDELLSMFDKVFLLKASEKATRKRLATRKSNNFGCADDVQEWVLTWKDWWENHMLEKGAIIIDANRKIKEIANDIIKKSKT